MQVLCEKVLILYPFFGNIMKKSDEDRAKNRKIYAERAKMIRPGSVLTPVSAINFVDGQIDRVGDQIVVTQETMAYYIVCWDSYQLVTY